MRFQTIYEARWIFAVTLLLTWGLYWVQPWLAVIGGVFTLYVFYFFRDPDRVSPAEEKAVVAAADGVVSDIVEVDEPAVLKTGTRRVGIFLSVFDVHTNRAPIAGKVTFCHHTPGKFLDARHPEATTKNEYMTWAFASGSTTLVVRQITGAIARRIVGWSKVGDTVAKGERFGMIRFGSRTEVYLPLDATITIKVGDRVQGGLTIIARLK